LAHHYSIANEIYLYKLRPNNPLHKVLIAIIYYFTLLFDKRTGFLKPGCGSPLTTTGSLMWISTLPHDEGVNDMPHLKHIYPAKEMLVLPPNVDGDFICRFLKYRNRRIFQI
jgi:hypothetical protein